jgi:hypothetical protein
LKVEGFTESQKGDLFAFINMSSKTHQPLFCTEKSGPSQRGGFSMGLACPALRESEFSGSA